MTRRIGLLGGSFDPVHNAHLALACTALDTLALDELRWIPAGRPWQKVRHLSSSKDRAAMLQLAIAGEPRFVLERCELDRTGPTYTLETVRELQQRIPDAQWMLIIGQDQFANLHTWFGWQELLSRVTLAVAARPGVDQTADELVRAHAYQVLAMPLMDITATAIRERVARGESIDASVPYAVARYIEQHALYRSGGANPGS